jgi:hypothetical protein
MITVQTNHSERFRLMWLAVALAFGAALAYLFIAWGLLGVGDLQADEKGDAIVYVAAGSYLLGGLLILAGRRWLWVVGAVVNLLVLFFFFLLYQERPAVLFSPGGVVSKIPQVLLEVVLVYLIIADWLRTRRQSGG